MPLYVYRCSKGHEVEALVKHDGSNAPVTCTYDVAAEHKRNIDEKRGSLAVPRRFFDSKPLCGEPLTRVIAANAKLFPGADSWRK